MKSYDDPAKRLAREKFYEFILKHLIIGAGLKPKDIKVVCLETAEALEIKEIYDRLGIPRQNITVIECDPKVAAEIRAQNLGVRVINLFDYEYFESTADGPFHIISLDYKGKKNVNIINSIGHITRNLLLTHHNAILSLNTYGARESTEKDYLFETAKLQLVSKQGPIYTQTDSNTIIASMQSVFDNVNSIDVDLNQARDNFTTQVLGILNTGDMGISFCDGSPITLCYPYSNDFSEKIKGLYKNEKVEVLSDQMFPIFFFHHLDNFKRHILSEFKMQAFSNNVHAQDLCDSIFLLLIRAYYVRHLERYKYISINGAPMEFDLFHIFDYEKIISQIKKYFSIQQKSYGKILKIDKHKIKNYKKFHKLICTIITDRIKNGSYQTFNDLPERIFLGSSAKILKQQKPKDASI